MIVCDILNKDIILPTLLLPLKVVYAYKSNIFRTCSLIIPTLEVLQSLLRAYLHGKNEVHYDTNACFLIEKHKAKYLKRKFSRFKLMHQFQIQFKTMANIS